MKNKILFSGHIPLYIFGTLLQVLTIHTPESNAKLAKSTSKEYYTVSNQIDPFNHEKHTSVISKPFFWDSEEFNEIENFDDNDSTKSYMPDIYEMFRGMSSVGIPRVYNYPPKCNKNDADRWVKKAMKKGYYKNFDLRKKWGKICPSITEISEQGCCESCWAVVATAVWSDRLCMHNNGINNTDRYSARALMTCCPAADNCKSQQPEDNNACCSLGFQNRAWIYWTRNKIATGGFFGTGCFPYPKFPRCGNSTAVPFTSYKMSFLPCANSVLIPDVCPKICDNPKLKMESSKLPRVKTSRIYYQLKRNNTATTANDEVGIKMEIFKHGPVHAIIKSSFKGYKPGDIVNPQPEDTNVSAHSVRILGWGEEEVRPGLNQSYWIVANSWGTGFGDKGFFKLAFNFTSYEGTDNIVYAGLYKDPVTC